MQGALFVSCCLINECLIYTSGCARASIVQKSGRLQEAGVTQLEGLIRAFADKHATIESVALAVGKLGSKMGGEYNVQLAHRGLGDVRVGIIESSSPQSEPGSVVIYPSLQEAKDLSKLVPFCGDWRKIPGNPKASPSLYACAPQLNLPNPVRIIAQLDAAIEKPDARITSLVLQR